MNEAIATAKRKVSAAEAADIDAQECENAREAIALLAQFAKRGQELDARLQDFVAEYVELTSDFRKLGAIGISRRRASHSFRRTCARQLRRSCNLQIFDKLSSPRMSARISSASSKAGRRTCAASDGAVESKQIREGGVAERNIEMNIEKIHDLLWPGSKPVEKAIGSGNSTISEISSVDRAANPAMPRRHHEARRDVVPTPKTRRQRRLRWAAAKKKGKKVKAKLAKHAASAVEAGATDGRKCISSTAIKKRAEKIRREGESPEQALRGHHRDDEKARTLFQGNEARAGQRDERSATGGRQAGESMISDRRCVSA